MNFNHAEKGQSLVELALTLTLILTLLAGAVDLGSAFFSYVVVRDAAQEGALYGSVAPYYDSNDNDKYDSGEPLNTTAIVLRVQSASTTPGFLSGVTPIVTTSDEPCACVTVPCAIAGVPKSVPNSITVSVTYNYPLTMPLIGAIIGQQTIPLTASATDTIIKPSCP
jgi:Flp pilus assembly protein TadG